LRWNVPSLVGWSAKRTAQSLSLSVIRFARDLVVLDLLVEIRARRLDDLGRAADVPAVLAETGDEELALGELLEVGKGRQLETAVRDLGRLHPDLGRQIACVDRIGVRHDEDALDEIAQLADVARPRP